LSLNSQKQAEHDWCIDSGATDHICNTESLFQTIQMLRDPHPVYMRNGAFVEAIGIATMQLRIGGGQSLLQLSDVLLAPEIRYNLIAATKLEKDYRISFSNGVYSIHDPSGRAIVKTCHTNGLFRIQAPALPAVPTVCLVAAPHIAQALQASREIASSTETV